MSDQVILALIAGIPSTLAALAALVVGLRNSRKSDVIAGHVDGMASASAEKINGLERQVTLLLTVMTETRPLPAPIVVAPTPVRGVRASDLRAAPGDGGESGEKGRTP